MLAGGAAAGGGKGGAGGKGGGGGGGGGAMVAQGAGSSNAPAFPPPLDLTRAQAGLAAGAGARLAMHGGGDVPADERGRPLVVETPKHASHERIAAAQAARATAAAGGGPVPTATPDLAGSDMAKQTAGKKAGAHGTGGPGGEAVVQVGAGGEEGAMVPLDDFETHPPAGEGRYFAPAGTHAAKAKAVLRKSSAHLPEGFVRSVFETHTGRQHVDYLPSVPNLNTAKSVGVVKPRHIFDDWQEQGFDPWSEGKQPFSTSFIPSLMVDPETGEDMAKDQFADAGGMTDAQKKVEQANKEQKDLDMLLSWCRHGKYSEIETSLNHPDWTLPIDAKDAGGNTLLLVSAQNGNKRIAKLCLRRGADINMQNLNGQTVLHYCFAYGFEDLAQYFMDKGGDDSLVNADGLTCYEGLTMEDVEKI